MFQPAPAKSSASSGGSKCSSCGPGGGDGKRSRGCGYLSDEDREHALSPPRGVEGHGRASRPRYYESSDTKEIDDFLEETRCAGPRSGEHWYYSSPQRSVEPKGHHDVEVARRVRAMVEAEEAVDRSPAAVLGESLLGRVLESNASAGSRREHMASEGSSLLQQVLGNLRGSNKVQPAPPSRAQSTLKHYRGILRVQERQDRQAAAIERKTLEQQREAVYSHGLWLSSLDKSKQQQEGEPRESEESEESQTYWGEMAAKYDVQPPPDTVFRRGKGKLMKFGVRNSLDPARNAGKTVKRMGTLVAVCNRDFEEERETPGQALLTSTMGRAAKADRLRFYLRPRVLVAFLRVLQSPLNPPGIAYLNILKLHETLQATASLNPQPWVLSRAQVVRVLVDGLHGVSERMANQLVSCYDLANRDRVRFAEITSNLVATMPPATLMLQGISDDYGPYKLALTVFRQVFKLYASVTESRLRYGTLLELLRSCTATVQGISEIDDAFRLFMNHTGKYLKADADEQEVIDLLKSSEPHCRLLLDVFQKQLQAFQSIVQEQADDELNQRSKMPKGRRK